MLIHGLLASSSCSAGILNVVSLGADGTVAGDNAAFQAAYDAVTTTTSDCYNVPIFVPGRNTPGWQGQPWPGHWPVITKPVTIEGAGANATNFAGDSTGWPVFWVQAPNVKLSSFGFWGSPAVNIKLDAVSGAALSHIGCRSSSQIFVYAGAVSDVTLTGVTSEDCGSHATTNPLQGSAVVILSSNNVVLNGFESFGANNWSIAVQGSQGVVFNGGKTDYAFAFNMTDPLVWVNDSSVKMTNGFWMAGTNSYELSLNGNSTFTGENIAFGGGSRFASPAPNIYLAPTSTSSFTCNSCVFNGSDPTVPYKTPATFEVDTTSTLQAPTPTTISAFTPANPIITVSGGEHLTISKASAPYLVDAATP